MLLMIRDRHRAPQDLLEIVILKHECHQNDDLQRLGQDATEKGKE